MKSIELQRKALYNEACNYLIHKVGYIGNLVDYADVHVDDRYLSKYTPELLAESYLSDEIGEFDTSEDVVKYYQDECGVWEDEDPKGIGTRLEYRGDILQIKGVWYWNM